MAPRSPPPKVPCQATGRSLFLWPERQRATSPGPGRKGPFSCVKRIFPILRRSRRSGTFQLPSHSVGKHATLPSLSRGPGRDRAPFWYEVTKKIFCLSSDPASAFLVRIFSSQDPPLAIVGVFSWPDSWRPLSPVFAFFERRSPSASFFFSPVKGNSPFFLSAGRASRPSSIPAEKSKSEDWPPRSLPRARGDALFSLAPRDHDRDVFS